MKHRTRAIATVAAVSAIVLTLPTASALASPQDIVAADRQSLVVYNAPTSIDGIPTFGANEPVELIGGFLPIFEGCPDPKKDDRAPVVIATSDIIVQGGGSEYTTTVPALGGLNLGASVGITGPTGALGTGTYNVIYDECQDGGFTRGQDAEFFNAFRVVVPVDAPIIDLGATKDAAAGILRAIKGVQAGAALQSKINKVATRLGLGSLAVRDASTTDDSALIGSIKSLYPFAKTLVNPTLQGTALDGLDDAAVYAQLIYNDPPDTAYGQPTLLVRQSLPSTITGNASTDAVDSVNADAKLVSETEQALLHAMERYQGAAAAQDGQWALTHAREISEFSALLKGQLADLDTAVMAWAATVSDTPQTSALRTALARLSTSGLSADQKRELRNDGDSAAQVNTVQTNLAQTDFGAAAPAKVTAALSALQASLSAWPVALGALQNESQAAAATLAANHDTGTIPPTADAGTAYQAAAGGTVTLNGARSAGGVGPLRYRWDLNGDGAFDDAQGATPRVPAGAVGTRVIAVEVTDADGQNSYAYAPLTVTSIAATLPVVAPTSPALQQLTLGGTQNFSVSGSGPTIWTLDGSTVSTSTNYVYHPTTLTQAGGHLLSVTVGAPGSRQFSADWPIIVQGNDSDHDGWTANTDCDDTQPEVNPGRDEILGNGLDDDCDPFTLDGPAAAGSGTFTHPDFASLDGLTLVGTARQNGRAVRLTDPSYFQDGGVWSNTAVTPIHSFSSTFDVSFANAVGTPADGVAFVVQTSPDAAPIGGDGGRLGYGGIAPSVAVEFDTYQNEFDPDNNHVAVDVDGDVTSPKAILTMPFSLYGTPFRARIAYDAAAKRLTVYAGQNATIEAAPLLTVPIDLSATLGSAAAHVGIVSSTGISFESSDLLDWAYSGGTGVSASSAPPTVPGIDLITTAGTPVTTKLNASIPAQATGPAFAVAVQPAHGSARIDGNTAVYTPAAGFTGLDSFAYTATSTSGTIARTSQPGVAVVTVNATTAAPTVDPIPDLSTSLQASMTSAVTAHAPGASSLTLTAQGLPPFASFQDLGGGHGLITAQSNGAAPGTYPVSVLATDESGTTTARATITVPGDRPPTTRSIAATTTISKPVTLTPTASDPDGDSLTYRVLTPPAHGSVTQSGPAFVYTPTGTYSGSDAFTFGVSDGTLSTTGAAQISVTTPDPPAPPTTDSVVSQDFSHDPGLVTTPSLAAHAGDLLLAFIAVNASTPLGSVGDVEGGGLSWTRIGSRKHSNGTVEIWQAHATTPFSAVVTTTLRRCNQCSGSVTVAAFQGAGQKAGTVAGDDGSSMSLSSVKVKASSASSLLWAVGQDPGQAGEISPLSGQQVVHEDLDAAARTTAWVQDVLAPSGGPGPVTVLAERGSPTDWQMLGVEIPAAPAP